MPDLDKARDELRAAIAEYDATLNAARMKRDDALRAAIAAGLKQADVVRETGYSRETIRVVLLPEEQREAIRARRRKTED